MGVFDIARIAPGRPCDFVVELNGSRGTLRFDYARLNELWFADAGDPPELYGMRRIRAEHTAHPETQGWWPIGQGIGYGAGFVNQAADLLAEWPDGAWRPDLDDGSRRAGGLRGHRACRRAAALGRGRRDHQRWWVLNPA
jgi:hypothetical protein